MEESPRHPLVGATEHWEALLEDLATVVEEYRERDWTALDVEPGDVTVDPDLPGFSVLLADNEFEAVTELLGASGVDGYRVYLGSAADVVFAAIALEDSRTERAAVVPLYYSRAALQGLRPAGEEAGRLVTRLRTLADREFVVEHEGPEPFFPGAERE
jgi:hypothetical protein